jgi:hypothetical protein
MVEKRARSKTSSLTPDHLKLGINPILVRWKALEESYNFGSDLVPTEFGVKSYERPKSRESKPGQFRDSTLGVPGKRTIWMQVRRRAAENTIWGKVVASPESGPWWVKWVQGSPWLVPTPKGCRMSSNQLVGWIWM